MKEDRITGAVSFFLELLYNGNMAHVVVQPSETTEKANQTKSILKGYLHAFKPESNVQKDWPMSLSSIQTSVFSHVQSHVYSANPILETTLTNVHRH